MLARDNENFRTPARIELTTLRILHVYRTFQPLNRRVASSILARGMEISFVPGGKFIEKDGRDFTFLKVIHICEAERIV